MRLSSFKRLFLLLTLLTVVSGCCPNKLCPQIDPPPLPEFCVPERIRIALVLGSGGVRGMAHVGVLEELENAGIDFDIIVGCSAGSLVGALYADNPDSHCIRRAVSKLKRDSILDINLWECRYGLSQGKAFKRVLHDYLEARCFEDLKMPLVVVATDLNSGDLIPIGAGPLIPAVRASCAIPLVFVPVEINGRILVDGGVINPVPARVARDLGAEFIIAVDLCELLPTTFPTNLFGVAKRSTEIIFLWQNDVCTRAADVVIRPRMCDVGTFDDTKIEYLYEAGKAAAREAIPSILEKLAALKPVDEADTCKTRCFAPHPITPQNLCTE